MSRGFFGIGIEHCKTVENLGGLWRSAHAFGAAFVFVIGQRYRRQPSDTVKAWKSIPLFTFSSFDSFYSQLPHDSQLVGVELLPESEPIKPFAHPERAVYLLGAEDNGLTQHAISKCHRKLVLPGRACLNVASAGSIVMFDRLNKESNK